MSVNVKIYTSHEIQELKEKKYKEFLYYYNNTDIYVNKIFEIIGYKNNKNSTRKYITQRLREEGYNSLERSMKIRKGEWL